MLKRAHSTDSYLASLSEAQRVALERLRRAIHKAAPEAEECISYQLPAFRLAGRFLVAFGAASNHCAFYPGALPIAKYRADLNRYDTSKGTIRFQVDAPLPIALIRKIVTSRVAEISGKPRR